jgi:hypothetical protein
LSADPTGPVLVIVGLVAMIVPPEPTAASVSKLIAVRP